ncbi:cysteine desulfurase [Plakobranchus ocellatus]|uniref:Cysteine desulfurase n=1 Tax=Plakobranchus ocellatus TaxID=259542 RepID=A0AAV3YGG8_9GAST|nr:cysteine desulfurase [Plakobranchus ocellatus]
MAFMLSVPGNTPVDRHLDTDGLAQVEFGADIKEKEFFLRPDISFFNHGSYGAVPRRVLKLQEEYNREREVHPDFWFRLNAKRYLDQARELVAQYVGAHTDNIQLVRNATTAINCVVRSYPFAAGDALLRCTFTYGAITNLCEDFTSRIRPDVESVNLQLSFPPASEDDILKEHEKILSQHPNIKVAIIDHITSPSSIIMPLKRLVDLCHSHGVKVIVDGAHCLGQLPLDLENLGADVYTANAHKWLYTPRGCAILYLSKESQAWAQPPNTSWQIGRSLDKQFFDQGTQDHIPMICCKHGLEFYQAVGGMDQIVKYTRTLADEAVKLIEAEVGLKPAALPKSMEAPNLRLLEFPPLKEFPISSENLWKLHRALFGETSVFSLIVPVSGKFYLRICTQIYMTREDVASLVQVLKDFFSTQA